MLEGESAAGPFLDRKRDLVAVRGAVVQDGQHQQLVDSLGERDLLHDCVASLGSWSRPRAAMYEDRVTSHPR